MNFLEARRIAANPPAGNDLRFLLAMSGTAEPLQVYLGAHAAQTGHRAVTRTLPFNTLGQALHLDPIPDEKEVFLLTPWDFVPELDWRSGIGGSLPNMEALGIEAESVAARLTSRRNARFLYLPAATPPLLPDARQNRSLATRIAALSEQIGAEPLPPDAFGLAGYLVSGCPVSASRLADVAKLVIDCALSTPAEPKKVLVTDLDNVLWRGVVGEDGVDGIGFGPEGTGHLHFIYQTVLRNLKHCGVLLAAVSRNQPEIAEAPLVSGRMVLGAEDFVGVLASYGAKSAHIRQLAITLNLGLDCFVFVDDNPIELAEVSAELPEVTCLAFPDFENSLPGFLNELAKLFSRSIVTDEDRERTNLYRRRSVGLPSTSHSGADVTQFLRSLKMKLTLRSHSVASYVRAIQLINKTNQFNLNGYRYSESEIAGLLERGARLYSATLDDRTGSHGEILACLVTDDGVVESLVMSCRVFQRRIEYALLCWLAGKFSSLRFDFADTPRNEPIRQFLSDPAFVPGPDGKLLWDGPAFRTAHAADLELFELNDTCDD